MQCPLTGMVMPWLLLGVYFGHVEELQVSMPMFASITLLSCYTLKQLSHYEVCSPMTQQSEKVWWQMLSPETARKSRANAIFLSQND